MPLLADRNLLITGVLTDSSIAFAVAAAAQREGAEVVLTGFGRGLRITERVARRLPTPADVLEMDVNDPAHVAAVAEHLDARWGHVDGVLHAIAFAPPDALGGRFLETPSESAEIAFRTSAFSLKALAAGLLPLLAAAPRGASIVGLDFDATVAWPVYDWQGVAKAALESVSRYLARDLGARGIRSNLVAAGPLSTVAARGIDGFEALAATWVQQAPLGWDLEDPTPVADACVFLLSDLARGITGEIVHVDGGVHAVGAAPPAAAAQEPDVPDQRNGSSEPSGHSPASSPHNRLA
jgi:enoyl-[acyl-carrier protein] reductase I